MILQTCQVLSQYRAKKAQYPRATKEEVGLKLLCTGPGKISALNLRGSHEDRSEVGDLLITKQ